MNDEGSAKLKYWANTRPVRLAFNFMLSLFYIADNDLQYTKILFPLASGYPSISCTNYLLEYNYYLGHTVPRGASL